MFILLQNGFFFLVLKFPRLPSPRFHSHLPSVQTAAAIHTRPLEWLGWSERFAQTGSPPSLQHRGTTKEQLLLGQYCDTQFILQSRVLSTRPTLAALTWAWTHTCTHTHNPLTRAKYLILWANCSGFAHPIRSTNKRLSRPPLGPTPRALGASCHGLSPAPAAGRDTFPPDSRNTEL